MLGMLFPVPVALTLQLSLLLIGLFLGLLVCVSVHGCRSFGIDGVSTLLVALCSSSTPGHAVLLRLFGLGLRVRRLHFDGSVCSHVALPRGRYRCDVCLQGPNGDRILCDDFGVSSDLRRDLGDFGLDGLPFVLFCASKPALLAR